MYIYNLQSEMEHIDFLEEISKKWILAQMKHHVSAEAANSFWDLAMKYVPLSLQQRQKKIPQFVHQRRKMYQNYCPEVHMEFVYKNKLNGEIVTYKGTSAPLKMYQNNFVYEKLYELAFIKVMTNEYHLFHMVFLLILHDVFSCIHFSWSTYFVV